MEFDLLYISYKKLTNRSYLMSGGMDTDEGHWGDNYAMNCRIAEGTNLFKEAINGN